MNEYMKNKMEELMDAHTMSLDYMDGRERGFEAACETLVPLLREALPHVEVRLKAAQMVAKGRGITISPNQTEDLIERIKQVTE